MIDEHKSKKAVITLRQLIVPAIIIMALAITSFYFLRPEESEAAFASLDYWPTEDWRYSSPETQGFDSSKLAQGLLEIKSNNINIHSLMVVRNGEVILDAYFYPYDGSTLHDLASVTKSVTTTLIGIAIDQGRLELDTPILSFFPEYEVANRDSLKEKVTIRHLVSMSSGFSCIAVPDEVTLEEMTLSPDWIQFALDRPMAAEPGTRFVYDSLGMHLLSAILQKTTGMTALEYAKLNLFEPLGIKDVFWSDDPQGYTRGWGDLCLYPEDAAKIGLLFLYGGSWGEEQVVSSEWVTKATAKQMSTGTIKAEDYGYGWYISREDLFFFRADGTNGQRILVIPSMNLVLVTTGGGFELDDVTPYIEAAIIDLSKPAPTNLEGESQLQEALTKCLMAPTSQPVPQPPSIAASVSNLTYSFNENLIQIRSIRLELNDSPIAMLYIDLANEPTQRVTQVGLDGVYRASLAGKPSVARGRWTDDQTFSIDYNEGPGRNYYRFQLSFDGETLSFVIPGLITIQGTLEK